MSAAALIPPAAIVLGAAIMKPEWLPYAVAVAALVGGLAFFATSSSAAPAGPRLTFSELAKGGEEKETKTGVLDPKEFAEFPLVEKQVISHNTAVYALHSALLPF